MHFYLVRRAALSPCRGKNHLLLHDGKKITCALWAFLLIGNGKEKETHWAMREIATKVAKDHQ
jgi:hypothetical protein